MKGTRAYWIDYFPRMRRRPVAVLCLSLLAPLACGGHATPGAATPPPPQPAEHSLSGLAAQHVAVLPTYAVRVMPGGLPWSIDRPADIERSMDAEIASAFEERGLKRQWVFPDQLQASYRQNPTYATDPYSFAEEPLRSPALANQQRLPEPLASQIRTMVALRDDVRYVLAPVEVRLERASATTGREVLKVVLLDARGSEVVWSGEFSSDPASSYGPALAATIAARLAAAVSPQ